jgi:single-strand DNA-binding protein
MYQKIIIVGNLGGDPKIEYMADSTAVCTFSLATNRRWNNAQGQPVEETTWFRVSIWGKRAEAANQYLQKGSKVLVEGRLKPDPDTGSPRIFNKANGEPATSYEVTADNFSFVGSKADTTADGQTSTPYQKQTPQEVMDRMVAGETIAEDDIPF